MDKVNFIMGPEGIKSDYNNNQGPFKQGRNSI